MANPYFKARPSIWKTTLALLLFANLASPALQPERPLQAFVIFASAMPSMIQTRCLS